MVAGFYIMVGGPQDMLYNPTMTLYKTLPEAVGAIVGALRNYLVEEFEGDMDWNNQQIARICYKALPASGFAALRCVPKELLQTDDIDEVCAEIEATDFTHLFGVEGHTRCPQVHIAYIDTN